MSQLIKHDIQLAPLTSFKIGGTAKNFARVKSRDELAESIAWAKDKNLAVFVLGEGSNLVFAEKEFGQLIVKVEIKGLDTLSQDETGVVIKVGAGEHWDSVVERAVDMKLAGIEAMSMIPGTAGATPYQNVGAYGQEIGDTLESLEAYDLQTAAFTTLSHDDCGFGYRDSIFRSSQKGRYIITSITLKLRNGATKAGGYKSLRGYLDEHGITDPSVAQIRQAVMAIRAQKLPDPSVVPSAGSFFKNPIVDDATIERLKKDYPEMPTFIYQDKHKIPAGWLIETAGLKGKTVGKMKVYDKHAQVITNPNGAGYQDLLDAVAEISNKVHDKFGIMLEVEPQLIS